MWQEVVVLVEELEARPGVAPRVLRSDRQRRDQVAERPEHAGHQGDGRVRQRPELRVGLLRVREVPLQDLQEDLVADVEEVRALDVTRSPMRGTESSRSPRRTVANITGRTGSNAGIRREHLRYSSRICDELAEVRRLPMPARPLALLEDRVERSLGRREVGYGHELGPPEIGARRLCARRPDEQVALAELVSEVRQTLLDRAIQVADGCEVLQLGHDVAFGHQRAPPRARGASMPVAPSSAMPSGRSRNMKC